MKQLINDQNSEQWIFLWSGDLLSQILFKRKSINTTAVVITILLQ